MSETLLVITTAALTSYSARGLFQTLEPIQAATQLARDVNGTLIDLSNPALRKYRSTISCRDMNVPVFDGIWPGQQVTVSCVSELSYVTSGGSPARTVVSGSSRTVGAHTFYRPQLTMRIVRLTTDTDEWGAEVGWSIELEEV